MQAIAKQTERSFSHRLTINPVSDTADTHGIDKSLVSKWNKQRDAIIEAARKRSTAHKTKKSTKLYKFAITRAQQVQRARLQHVASSYMLCPPLSVPG